MPNKSQDTKDKTSSKQKKYMANKTSSTRSVMTKEKNANTPPKDLKLTIYNKVIHLLEEKQVFLDSKCSLGLLSSVVGTNTELADIVINPFSPLTSHP